MHLLDMDMVKTKQLKFNIGGEEAIIFYNLDFDESFACFAIVNKGKKFEKDAKWSHMVMHPRYLIIAFSNCFCFTSLITAK